MNEWIVSTHHIWYTSFRKTLLRVSFLLILSFFKVNNTSARLDCELHLPANRHVARLLHTLALGVCCYALIDGYNMLDCAASHCQPSAVLADCEQHSKRQGNCPALALSTWVASPHLTLNIQRGKYYKYLQLVSRGILWVPTSITVPSRCARCENNALRSIESILKDSRLLQTVHKS